MQARRDGVLGRRDACILQHLARSRHSRAVHASSGFAREARLGPGRDRPAERRVTELVGRDRRERPREIRIRGGLRPERRLRRAERLADAPSTAFSRARLSRSRRRIAPRSTRTRGTRARCFLAMRAIARASSARSWLRRRRPCRDRLRSDGSRCRRRRNSRNRSSRRRPHRPRRRRRSRCTVAVASSKASVWRCCHANKALDRTKSPANWTAT